VHVGEKVEGGVKTIEERIAEAKDEARVMGLLVDACPTSQARHRLLARAEKRLADLEAVRDGKAAFVHAVASVTDANDWSAVGTSEYDPTLSGARPACRPARDRITILRGVAWLPVETTDEVDAESSDV
jgi:hypothetical protein